jgi:hypothetical protein
LLCRFVAKKAGLAGKTEEEEIYTDIILELVVQVCGKEGWPGGKREEEDVYAGIIQELVVQVCGKEGWPGGQDRGGGDLC